MITYDLPDQFVDNSRLYLIENAPFGSNFLGTAQPTLFTFMNFLDFNVPDANITFKSTEFLNILTTPTEYDSESTVVIPPTGQIYIWATVSNSNIDIPITDPLYYYQL